MLLGLVLLGLVLLGLVLSSLAGETSRAQASDSWWVRQAGGLGSDAGFAVAGDGSGNALVAGRFAGVAKVAGLDRVNALRVYLAKFAEVKALFEAPKSGDEQTIAARLKAANMYKLETGKRSSTGSGTCCGRPPVRRSRKMQAALAKSGSRRSKVEKSF